MTTAYDLALAAGPGVTVYRRSGEMLRHDVPGVHPLDALACLPALPDVVAVTVTATATAHDPNDPTSPRRRVHITYARTATEGVGILTDAEGVTVLTEAVGAIPDALAAMFT